MKIKRAVKVLLLLVVRDPVTRLISDYAQILENHRKRNLEYKSFEEAAFHGNSGAPNRNYDAIQKVRYVRKQVEYYQKLVSEYNVVSLYLAKIIGALLCLSIPRLRRLMRHAASMKFAEPFREKRVLIQSMAGSHFWTMES